MNRTLQTVLLFFAASIFESTVVADERVAQSLYQIQCVVCHGNNAEGNSKLNSPALAGQQAAYTQRQLKNFKLGLRAADERDVVGKQMIAFATTLDDESRTLLAEYLSELPRKKPDSIGGDIKRGGKYYQAYCGSCHGSDASGNEMLNSPDLRGLSGEYLKRQYQNFVDGIRGIHVEDKYGRQMALIASGLTDSATVDSVVAYIVSLQQ